MDTTGVSGRQSTGPARGGQLNLIVERGSYGGPPASDGAEYGTDNWPFAVNLKISGGDTEPAHPSCRDRRVARVDRIT